jgi:hypothetical protein
MKKQRSTSLHLAIRFGLLLSALIMTAAPAFAQQHLPLRDAPTPKQYYASASITHGFRLGGAYLMGMDEATRRQYGLSIPFVMLMGYEIIERVAVSRDVNVVFAQNLLIGGFEQSTFTFSLNAVIGMDLFDSFQFGAGLNISPGRNWTHAVIFVSWTPKLGNVMMPLTLSFVPDKDGDHRIAFTIGISWSHILGTRAD